MTNYTSLLGVCRLQSSLTTHHHSYPLYGTKKDRESEEDGHPRIQSSPLYRPPLSGETRVHRPGSRDYTRDRGRKGNTVGRELEGIREVRLVYLQRRTLTMGDTKGSLCLLFLLGLPGPSGVWWRKGIPADGRENKRR